MVRDNRKIKNKSGLPELNFGTLVNGIKLLPLQIVWGIYGLILFGVGIGKGDVTISYPVKSD